MPDSEKIFIEVAYAVPATQVLIPLDVSLGTTVEEAVKLSGILEQFPDINLAENKLGIFGKVTPSDQVLRDKDRVEIYRPLIADPKESRRKRAEKKESRTNDESVENKSI